MVAVAAAALAAVSGDRFITVDTVELPASGFDPSNMSLVINQTLRSCRKAGKPVIERSGMVIRILPQSQPATSNGRTPCATPRAKNKQLVYLGPLDRGTYRVQVVTGDSKIFKVLNIY